MHGAGERGRAVNFFDDFERAAEFAHKAMALMCEKGIPPSPKNFTIWYAYFANFDTDLTRLLDQLLGSGEEFTAERSARIFGQFFEMDMEAEAIRQTGALIQASVTKVLERIDEAGDEATHYGERLEDFSGQLAGDLRDNDLRAVVDGILIETKKMRERSEGLASELKRSSVEIVELKHNLESVRREAHLDGLTGIANRRAFDACLAEAIGNARESREALSLLMVDIDHFKRFNDQFGHPLGDKVLQLAARILKSSIKGRDTVARYGGEEFAIILPRTALCDAVTLAGQIRDAVATRKIVHRTTGDNYGTITLSVGVAMWRFGEAGEDLVKRADEALYRAKRAGRNRVVSEEAVATLVAS